MGTIYLDLGMFRLVWKPCCYCFGFFGFLFLRINIDLSIFIQTKSDSSCPEGILVKSVVPKNIVCYICAACNFSFRVWSLWGCKIMFLAKESVPSNKWRSCPVEFSGRSLHRWCDWKGCFILSNHGTTFKRCFWWVRPFLQNNVVLTNTWQVGFFKGVLLLAETVLRSNIKAS